MPIVPDLCVSALQLDVRIGKMSLAEQRLCAHNGFCALTVVVRDLIVMGHTLIHLGQLALGAFERRGPDLLQQAVHGVGRSGHLVVHDVGGIRGIAQQVGLLRAQADEIVDQLFVVILVAVVAAVEVGLVDLLAQFAFRRVGQKRDQAGLVQRKDVFALPAHRLGLFAGQIAGRKSKVTMMPQLTSKEFE